MSVNELDLLIYLFWNLMNLTWSKNTLLYLSTGEDDRNLMTSSSKSRRKKVNRYFVDGVRRYGQLCKFREREKKKSMLLFESGSLHARYKPGWLSCDWCVTLYCYPFLVYLLGEDWYNGHGKQCLVMFTPCSSLRQWPHGVTHFIKGNQD